MMGSESEESFDRLTRLAAGILKAPLTIVSFIGEDRQFFKSAHGLPEPWASNPNIPIEDSVCQYTLQGEPLLIEDARTLPLLKGNPAIPALNLVAYLGVPLTTSEGQNLGAFCVVDHEPRKWSPEEVEILQELGRSLMMEIELQMTTRNLKAAVRNLELERDLREKFVMTLTHDLRNPLSAAKLKAEILVRKPSAYEYVKETGNKIIGCISRIDAMIQNLLDASRLQAGKGGDIRYEPCDLNAISEIVAGEMTDLFGDRFTFTSEGSCTGYWNAEGLKRMIENLVTNAVKYGAEGRPITIEVKQGEGFAKVGVHNFGNPIPLHERARIFEPFHRSESAASGPQKGWGLGLTFVSGMAKSHGGTVEISSSQAAGTTFTVRLPIRIV
jgi:signal transduction histidine kinase